MTKEKVKEEMTEESAPPFFEFLKRIWKIPVVRKLMTWVGGRIIKAFVRWIKRKVKKNKKDSV